MTKRVLSGTAIFLALSAGVVLSQDKGGKGGGKAPAGPGLTLSSPDIPDGGVIPDKFTAKAGATSPSPWLEWKNVPAGTQSYVLLLHDPDVSLAKKIDDVTHWLMFNIPANTMELPAGIPAEAKLINGAIQIKNTANRVGYLGPGAPAAGPYHHYTFELSALDTMLDLNETATRADVVKAMEGHILAKGVLEARFHQ